MMMFNGGARGICNWIPPPSLETGSILTRIRPSSGLCSTLAFRLVPSIISLPTAAPDATTAPTSVSRASTARRRRGFVPTHTALVRYSFSCLARFRTRSQSSEGMTADDGPAFDDQSSTFIIPSGGGFQVMFCPPGRSSNILSTLSAQLYQLAATGSVTPQWMG